MRAPIDLALTAHTFLCSLRVPTLDRFLTDWPSEPPNIECQAASSEHAADLPVLRHLSVIARERCAVGVPLIEQFCAHAASLSWRRTYTAAQLGEEFVRNYGYAEIVGLHAAVRASRIACGFMLLGPATFYPRHRHEAEEIYIPLCGTASWQQGDSAWRKHPPGTFIYHGREEPHAMRTHDFPLLALYLWRSDNLAQKATLDPDSECP